MKSRAALPTSTFFWSRGPTVLAGVAAAFLLLIGPSGAGANVLTNQDGLPLITNSPGIVLDWASGNIIVAYNDDPFGATGIGASYRAIGGGPWIDSASPPFTVFGTELDSHITSDQNQFVYACMTSYDLLPPNTLNNGIYVSASIDGGVNFLPMIPVSQNQGPPGTLPFDVKPKIFADPFPASPAYGAVHSVFERDLVNLRNSNAMYSWSGPGGGAWSPPYAINDNLGQDMVLWPNLDGDPSGTMHAAWLDAPFNAPQGFQGRIMVDSEPNLGGPWGADIVAANFWTVPQFLTAINGAPTYMAMSYPVIKFDAFRPQLGYVAYAARPNSGVTNEVRLDQEVPPGSAGTGGRNFVYSANRVTSSNGWFHAIWTDYRAAAPGLYHRRTPVTNLTWPNPEVRIVAPGVGYGNFSVPALASAGSNVYVAWAELPVPGVYIIRSANDGGAWSAPIALDNLASTAIGNPLVTCTGQNVAVAWEAVATPGSVVDIRVVASTDGGVTWPASETVLTSGVMAGNHDIAINGNYIFVTWIEVTGGSTFQTWVRRSTNAGLTWQPAIRLDNIPPNTWGQWGTKVCASGNNVYAFWHDQRTGPNIVHCAYSWDNGASWSAEFPVSAATSDSKNVSVTCSGNGVYAVYESFVNAGTSYDIHFNHSTNGGLTWLGEVRIDNAPVGAGMDASCPRITMCGSNLFTVWWDGRNPGGGPTWDIYGNHSFNAGQSWPFGDYRIDVGDAPGANRSEYPHVACDQNTGVYHWQDFRNGLSDEYANALIFHPDESDVFLVRTIDGGNTWSAPMRVNDDATTNDNSHPWMEIKPNGTVDVGWLDKRLDPVDMQYDCYMASLPLMAPAFNPNVRVTNQSLMPPVNLWVGDYTALDVDQTQAHIAWPDTRSPWDGLLCDIYYDALGNPPPWGACCLPGGDCVMADLNDCNNQGGQWMGEGILCDPNPCEEPVEWYNHNVGEPTMTMTCQGILGFMDGTQTVGSGFIYPPDGLNQLYLGSPWVGLAPDYIANRDYDADPDREWIVDAPTGYIQVDESGWISGTGDSDQDIGAAFTDGAAAAPRGLYVQQESWAYGAPDPADDFIIINYFIENTSPSPMVDVHVGLFLDFDLETTSADDEGLADPAAGYAYLYDPSGIHAGVVLLQDDADPVPVANMTLVDNPTFVYPNAYMLDVDKDAFLRAADAAHILYASPVPNDYSVLASAGPFSLAPGEEKRVAFAVVGGTSLAHFNANAWVAQLTYDRGIVGVPGEASETITAIRLLPNRPNPFSDATNLFFELPAQERVRLHLYDVNGRRVRALLEETRAAGRHLVTWDGRDESGRRVADGIYFIKLSTRSASMSRPVLLLK